MPTLSAASLQPGDKLVLMVRAQHHNHQPVHSTYVGQFDLSREDERLVFRDDSGRQFHLHRRHDGWVDGYGWHVVATGGEQ